MNSKIVNKIYCIIVVLAVFIFGWLGFSKAANASLVITEIMYNLEGADDKREWIEIYNNGSEPIDLTDWRFNDGSNHLLVLTPEKGGQGSIIIQSNQYAVLAGDAVVFLNEHSGFSGTVIDTVMSLNNTFDTLKIIDNQGVEIDILIYESGWGANGNGMSLERMDFLGPNNSSNWQESKIAGGTPGGDNSSTQSPSLENNNQENNNTENNQTVQENNTNTNEQIEPQQENYDSQPNQEVQQDQPQTQTNYSDKIYINEIYPNTLGVDSEEEWIEIYNDSLEDIDLENWILDDEEGGSSAFIIPENTIIRAKNYLVLHRNKTNIALNNDKDEVRLFWPNETLADSVSYSSAPKGQSYDKIDNSWVWSATLTPENQNYENQPTKNNKDTNNNDHAQENLSQELENTNQKETKTLTSEINLLSSIGSNENTNDKSNKTGESAKTSAEINRAFNPKNAKNYYWLVLIIGPAGASGLLGLKYFLKNKQNPK